MTRAVLRLNQALIVGGRIAFARAGCVIQSTTEHVAALAKAGRADASPDALAAAEARGAAVVDLLEDESGEILPGQP